MVSAYCPRNGRVREKKPPIFLNQEGLAMLIVYTDGSEVIVCKKSAEKKMLNEYFTKGGRDKEDYDRAEMPDNVVCLNPTIRVG
jgi:hypothetical protein